MSSYMAKDVRCPYYGKDKNEKIYCSGEGIDDNVYVHIVFKSPSIRKDYQLAVCCDDYNVCPIAKMNNERWEGE